MTQPLRVLVVDDEANIGMAFKFAASSDLTIDVAETAEDGLALVARAPGARYDAYIIDKNLPGMGGLDLIRKLRVVDRDGPCILMTAVPTAASISETLLLGVEAYVDKPFDVYDVLNRVKAAAQRVARERRHAVPSSGARSHFQAATEHLQAAVEGKRIEPALVVAADKNVAEGLRARVAGFVSDIRVVASELAARLVLEAGPVRIALIDSSVGWSAVIDLVAHIEGMGVADRLIVITDEAPPLTLARHLIDLRITVLERQSGATETDDAIATILRRAAASGGGGGSGSLIDVA